MLNLERKAQTVSDRIVKLASFVHQSLCNLLYFKNSYNVCSLCCFIKLPHTWWLKTTQIFYLTFVAGANSMKHILSGQIQTHAQKQQQCGTHCCRDNAGMCRQNRLRQCPKKAAAVRQQLPLSCHRASSIRTDLGTTPNDHYGIWCALTLKQIPAEQMLSPAQKHKQCGSSSPCHESSSLRTEVANTQSTSIPATDQAEDQDICLSHNGHFFPQEATGFFTSAPYHKTQACRREWGQNVLHFPSTVKMESAPSAVSIPECAMGNEGDWLLPFHLQAGQPCQRCP